MKNIKKWLRRISISISVATLSLLYFATMVLAVPSDITQLTATATSNTISLTWTKVSGSVSTMIRYSTVTYPATPASGTLIYSGAGSYTTFNGLTSGTTYYISAWAYDGALYSTNAFHCSITTVSVVAQNTTIPYTPPQIPTQAYQDPSTVGWSWAPFDQIFAYFSDNTSTHGGLGMPTNNVIMLFAGVGSTFVGLMTYIKWHNFFGSWFIVTIICSFLSVIHVMQWIVVGMLLLVGVGVWAIEHNFQ